MEAGDADCLAGVCSTRIAPGHRYLDIGCGNATPFGNAQVIDRSWDGIDVFEEMVHGLRAVEGLFHTLFLHAEFQSLSFVPRHLCIAWKPFIISGFALGIAQYFRALEVRGRFVCTVDYYKENPASHDSLRK